MAKTLSAMNPLGSPAPDFLLPDLCSGEMVSLSNAAGSLATVIIFMCNHCPYVLHVIEELPKIANDFALFGIKLIGINANDTQAYPDDSPEEMKRFAQEHQMNFPYLFDESQAVAAAYDARCTPDFFVYDKNLKLVYRGQLDDSRPGSDLALDGSSLRHALNCLIQDQPIPKTQNPSVGCNIKWKA